MSLELLTPVLEATYRMEQQRHSVPTGLKMASRRPHRRSVRHRKFRTWYEVYVFDADGVTTGCWLRRPSLTLVSSLKYIFLF